jgi:phage terminase Nu1 subunit (DNA packaging protein)
MRTTIGKRRRGKEHLPSDLSCPVVAARWPVKRVLRLAPEQGAPTAIGRLTPGCEIWGLTKGQFSLPEILAAVLDQTGPAHVTTAAFTVAEDAIVKTRAIRDAGLLLSFRIILDRSIQSREREYTAMLLETFGAEAVRTTRNHAKWLVVRNAIWSIVVSTSMNFGASPRLEQFCLSDDPQIADLLDGVAAELWARPVGFNFDGDGRGLPMEHPALVPHLAEPDPSAKRKLGPSEAAVLLGISRPMVTRLRNNGRLTFDADGAAPEARLKEEHERYLRIKRQRIGTQEPTESHEGADSDDTATYYASRARREKALADLAELDRDTKNGLLTETSSVADLWFRKVRAVRDRLLDLPARLAAPLVGMGDLTDIRVFLDHEMRQILEELSNGPKSD